MTTMYVAYILMGFFICIYCSATLLTRHWKEAKLHDIALLVLNFAVGYSTYLVYQQQFTVVEVGRLETAISRFSVWIALTMFCIAAWLRRDSKWVVYNLFVDNEEHTNDEITKGNAGS